MYICLVALVVKKPPASAGDARDSDSIPGSGRSPGERNATHSSIFSWRIPWREEPGTVHRFANRWTRLKGLSTRAPVYM